MTKLSGFQKILHISPLFFCGLFLLSWAEPTLLLPALLSAAFHEFCHILALKACGNGVSSLKLTFFGAELTPLRPLSYGQEIFVAGAGPMGSVAFALFCAHSRRFLLAGMSFSLGFCNLLPIYPLDGGRVMGGLCALFLPEGWGERAARGVGRAASGAVLAAGVGLFLRYGGLTAPLLGLWLVTQNWNKRRA